VLTVLLRSVKIMSEIDVTCVCISHAVLFFCSREGESLHILSVDEKNKLGAKIIKAEMMGNMVRLLNI
jgi:hypothetical protein